MKFTITQKKTNSKFLVNDNDRIKSLKNLKDAESEEAKKEVKEEAKEEEVKEEVKEEAELTKEDIQALKKIIEVAPELLKLFDQIKSEDKKEAKEDDEKDRVIIEEETKEEDFDEEDEEELDEDEILSEDFDDMKIHDSVVSLESAKNNVTDSIDRDEEISNFFQDFYNKQLRKGE